MGYSFFDIPKLTGIEINALIKEHNKRQSDAKRKK
jgi:hypothetical protein